MISLINFNPLLDTMLPDVMDFSNRMFGEDLLLRNSSIPAVNVREHKNNYEIEVAAPGFSKKDFEVSVEDDILKISVENKKETKKEDANYSRQEFYYNSFERSFSLPKSVDLNKKIKANYDNGVLMIHLEKLEVAKKLGHKKKIEIS